MNICSVASRLLVLIALAGLITGGSFLTAQEQTSQEEWQWPEKAQNLQQLPKDFPTRNLRAVMTGFSRRLGVSCAHCHVGEEGAPLSTYNFVSDENPNKDTARLMLKMLGEINTRLRGVEVTGQRVNMWCGTCHRGRPRPTTVAEEFRDVYTADGIGAATAHVRDLRQRYYGKGAFDFSEGTLNSIGYTLLGQDQIEDAITVFRLNAEYHPESANAWDSLAEAYMKAGKPAQAAAYYQKSLQLNPDNGNAVEKLKELRP